jgi:hypothetical protein
VEAAIAGAELNKLTPGSLMDAESMARNGGRLVGQFHPEGG